MFHDPFFAVAQVPPTAHSQAVLTRVDMHATSGSTSKISPWEDLSKTLSPGQLDAHGRSPGSPGSLGGKEYNTASLGLVAVFPAISYFVCGNSPSKLQ